MSILYGPHRQHWPGRKATSCEKIGLDHRASTAEVARVPDEQGTVSLLTTAVGV